MRLRQFLVPLCLGGAVLAAVQPAPRPAEAATTTTTMAVTATVLSFCTVAASPLVFGNYTSAQLDATCTNGTGYTIGLDAGTGAGATTANRSMTGVVTAQPLPYSLHRNSARTQNWGDTAGTDTASGTGTGLPQTVTVYGRIASGQYPGPGAYADLITVTLAY